MLQDNMPGWIAHHGAMEQALQANVQAAQPQQPTDGNGGNGQAPEGQMAPISGAGAGP
jgi:hypothetical protein